MKIERNSIRLPGPWHLAGGQQLPEATVAWEAYGEPLAEDVILVCHGLTADAHAAGPATETKKAGWWDDLIGPGKMLDTDRFHVLCINVLGGCGGSTGPSSPDPVSASPYAMRFPVVTIADMVDLQKALLDELGIPRLYSAIGGCMGGFQVLEWARRYPEQLERAVVIGATARTSAHTLAMWHVLGRVITRDPAWNGGDYYASGLPTAGLGLSSAVGLLIWMDPREMMRRFDRRLRQGSDYSYSFTPDFEIEAFLEGIETSAGNRFDANSLLYLMRAMSYFDLEVGHSSLTEALSEASAEFLLVSYASDWRYPPKEVEKIRRALMVNGVAVHHVTLESNFGHGAFIHDSSGLVPVVRELLERPARQRRPIGAYDNRSHGPA